MLEFNADPDNRASAIWTEDAILPLDGFWPEAISFDGETVVGWVDRKNVIWTRSDGFESIANEAPGLIWDVSGDGNTAVGSSNGGPSYRWSRDAGYESFTIRRDLGEQGAVSLDWARTVSHDGSVVAGGENIDPGNRWTAWRWTSETGAVA